MTTAGPQHGEPMVTAVRFAEHGGSDVLRVESVPLPPVADDEVRVRHTAIGVNYSDVNVRRGGFYRSGPSQFPSGIGNEAVGVVDQVGRDVVGVRPGDRVGYVKGRGPFWADLGSYAAARNVPAERVIPVPDAIGDDDAASVMLKGLTVATMLKRVRVPVPGEVALVHAAASGVGSLLTEWLTALGVTVVGTVGTPAKADFARAHGAAHTILYREQNFVEAVRALYPGGVDVVFDGVGRDTFVASLDTIRRYGAIISYGNASGSIPPLDIFTLASKGSLWVNRTGVEVGDLDFYRASIAEIFDKVATGALRTHVHRVFPLTDARSAHEEIESGTAVGSILLKP